MPVEVTQELQVETKDEPGALAAVLATLAKAGVTVRAFCGYGMQGVGMVMLVPNDATKAKAALKKAGYKKVGSSDVVVATVKDKRGMGAQVAAAAAVKKINLDYAYASGTGKGNGVVVMAAGKSSKKLAKALG